MYFIKRTLSPAGKFEDFSLSKSKLRIILIKARTFPKNAEKNVKKATCERIFLKLQTFNLQFYKKMTLLWGYNNDFIKILKPPFLSAS